MKVAIFSESPADEAAIRILVDAILHHKTEPLTLAGIKSRGWGFVRSRLPVMYKQLHFNPEAEALVVVVDSDDSPIHDPSHEPPGNPVNDCRLCILRAIVSNTQKSCAPRPASKPLLTAIGIAVPAIEAWFRAGVDIHVTEQAWARGAPSRTFTRSSLKRDLYGSDRAPLAAMTEKLTQEARRLASDMSVLHRHFPNGFGPMLADLRTW